MTDLKVKSISIILENDKGETTNTLSWSNTAYMWDIGGPIYPRHIKLMDILNEFLRMEKGK